MTLVPPSPFVAVAPQRARGAVALSAKFAGGASRLDGFRQEGSLKALFPRPSGDALEAVLLNTAGGLTGGDRMRVEVSAGAGARLVVSTQAAERGYRAVGEIAARVEARIAVAPGGRVDWLPQETILYHGARVGRRLAVELEGDGTALLVEPLVVGRLLHGEDVRDGVFADGWEVRRDGRLLFAERLRLEGDMAAAMDRAGVAGGGRAAATVVLAAPAAEAMVPKVRAMLGRSGGASLVEEGVLVARVVAADGFGLRAVLVPIIEALAGSVPRVWRL